MDEFQKIFEFEIKTKLSRKCRTKSEEIRVLYNCFNGKIKLPKKNGKIFIDRDSKSFSNMLHFLRNSCLPNFNDEIEERNFFDELKFWKIPIKIIQKKSNFVFNHSLCGYIFAIDKSKKIITKKNSSHGIAILNPSMNIFNSYFEFKVNINSNASKNYSHLLIGLVDSNKFTKNIYMFFKNSPSIFYWDIYKGELYKNDENGKKIATKNNYGCKYMNFESEIKFGILYNQENRTVSFYKNNINFGIAFHNVPPNLNPTLEICFENGKIQILDAVEPEDKIYL